MGDDPRLASHEKRHAHSYTLLDDARVRAREESNYRSAETRQKMSDECQRRTGLTPRKEQLDFAECMLLGLDSTCIAGTGWGKTLAFALPLFVKGDKVMVVVSPLNVLETSQAERFREWGLKAVALNGTTYSREIQEGIEKGAYNMIIVGPKLCVDPESRFRPVLSTPSFANKILAVIIDEAHCITQWGCGFRPEYAQLDTFRAFIGIHVAVHLTSATMPPNALAQARRTLHIHAEDSFHLNLGNDRPNISWEVHRMTAGKSDLESLKCLLPDGAEERTTLPRALVFFDDIMVSMRARRWLLERLPGHLKGRVKGYHSRQGSVGKELTWELFRRGQIDVLFTTEAAGMGCDIPDIELVVQFMAPSSLSTWFQRAGRAGRRADIRARAILLVQPTVFHEKGKAKRQPGEPVQYVKQLEPGLRLWIEAPPTRCRRDIADEYFDSPRRITGQYDI
ncbi:P-loop containing nucleoside triphosphate hydrolase protein [Earliella scabrosa]|nr:P-loop containing nucleoside triphosphate hydrolase protein [Earliella scabrosa]